MTCHTLIALALFTALAIPSIAGAQPAGSPEAAARGRFLGLQQAIEAGLQNHPIVQEANAGLLASAARTDQNKSLYYPQVFANADGTAGSGRMNPRFLVGGALLQPNLSTYTAGVLASQRIYDFGYTKNLVESSQYGERAQEQDVSARRAISGEIMDSYPSLSFSFLFFPLLLFSSHSFHFASRRGGGVAAAAENCCISKRKTRKWNGGGGGGGGSGVNLHEKVVDDVVESRV